MDDIIAYVFKLFQEEETPHPQSEEVLPVATKAGPAPANP